MGSSKLVPGDAKNSLGVNSPIDVCLRKRYHLFLMIKHQSYFRYNDLLHTLSVYKILANEHHIVDTGSDDEVSVAEILF